MLDSLFKKIKDADKRKKLRIAVCSILLVALVFAGILLMNAIFAYFDGISEAEKLKNLYDTAQSTTLPSDSEPAAPVNTGESESTLQQSEPEAPKIVLPRYVELLKVNDEVLGWIKIDGTRIDYPLLHHDDNEYYLHTSIEGKKSKRGCVYIDFRNNTELTDKNTLIYAHNMKDGSMFKSIVSYKNKSFFDSHRKIHIDNLYEEGIWEVFSVYVVDANKETINIDYPDEESFIEEATAFKNRSMFGTGTQIGTGDRIVTLVTCSYETSNARTIVHAKYIGDGSTK